MNKNHFFPNDVDYVILMKVHCTCINNRPVGYCPSEDVMRHCFFQGAVLRNATFSSVGALVLTLEFM
jgi:hypothetical protein